MAKHKSKHRHPTPLSLPDTQARADKAMREGRFQAALELAKELFKREPTPAHKEMVQKAYLGRARQLRAQGFSRDAVTVLQAALNFADPQPEWLGQVAEELGACGEVQQALALLERCPGSSAHGRMLARAADVAVQQEAAGRKALPQSLHADFDRILQAFAQLEAGQDDAVLVTLQGIGLRSPFLEWKLLLRGLQAYYQQDDVRALENWQRLNAERLSARLAAPLRFLIDPGYRVAQVPEVQVALQKQADRLQGQAIVQELRAIQAAFARDESLHRAFRLAEATVPTLRQLYPHLVARLAACFYWTIISNGQPEDIARYQRVFGTPADDPQFARLRALVFEHAQEMEDAHQWWKQFEASIATDQNRNGEHAWSGEEANRARALVWYHMGQNAANSFDPEMLAQLPPFLRDHPDRPRPLSPPAETCFQNSLKLAPDLLESHVALFEYHREREEEAKAEKAARRLLERFPDHAPTLEGLADLCMQNGRYDEALELLQRALKTNPLSRMLRGKISGAHLFRARTRAEAGLFAEARADYQDSLNFRDGEDYPALCKWAACEYKAGDTARAEELLQQALAQSRNHLAVAYNMVIEAIRLKLPRTLKSRFDKDFNAALAEPPTGAGAAAILATALAHHRAGVNYYGRKTHEKKVLGYVEKARKGDFTEEQLEKVCEALLGMKVYKPLRAFTELGHKRYPNNPTFPFLEAESYFHLGPQRCPAYIVGPLLEKARRLAERLPRDPRQQQLLENIQEREQMIRSLNPLSAMFGGVLESMMDDFYVDADEDDY